MPKLKVEKELADGWTRWIKPEMKLYRLACCDCGLVHDVQFQVGEIIKDLGNGRHEYRIIDGCVVEFRVRRNNRSTAQTRRHKTKHFRR